MSDLTIRPMTSEEVPLAEQICSDAFLDLDQRTGRRDDPEPHRSPQDRRQRWITRTRQLLSTDAGGCWIAEDATGMVGFATSMTREQVWILATFAIKVGLQGKGVGRQLLDAAETHGAGCRHGMLSASNDPLALRRYHVAGFALLPQIGFRGVIDRSLLPAASGLREGTEDDREWMDELDRSLRGGGHGPDHAALASISRLVVADDRSGYAYGTEEQVMLLVAKDETSATDLLWECLAGAGSEPFLLPHLTTANPWAIEVGMAARLAMSTNGYLGLRNLAPPAPYIHHGALL